MFACCQLPLFVQTKYLPVLEKDTVLRVEVFDYDAVNVTSFAGLRDSAMLKVCTHPLQESCKTPQCGGCLISSQ